jgi:hypothetical protein
MGDIPIEEITEVIESNCNFPQPYVVHTDATTATVTIADSSSLILNLDSIRSISLQAELTGTVSTAANAWVRWGQDVPFGDNCATISTDNGWVGLDLPFNISLDLALDLVPSYDNNLLALVVDKHATLSGQAEINGGNLQHDFGTASPTDLVLSIFEDELLLKLQTNGEQAVADAIAGLNFRLDGLDENGMPDPTITAFNAPTTFVLDVNAEDEAFVRDLLLQFGIPDLVITMLDDRGVEILLQLVILQGAEREAYLAALGASVSCEVILNAYALPLDVNPIYALNGQVSIVNPQYVRIRPGVARTTQDVIERRL